MANPCQFAVDVDQDNPTFPGSCPHGDTCSSPFYMGTLTNVNVTINFPAGNYTYFCTYHPTMVGNLIVQPSPDFSVSSNPTSLSLVQGSTGTSMINVASQSGFSGTVTLSANVSPAGPAVALNPSSLTISSGTSMTSVLTVNSTRTPAGSYTVTVTSSNTTNSHSATISVTIEIPDFSIAASPTTVAVNAGSAGTSTITVTGLNGFTGFVALTTNSTWCSLSPTGVTGSGTSTLSCNFASPGTFHVGVTGTNTTLSHSVTVTFIVQDFTIAASPTSVAINAGSAATSSITVTAKFGFSGKVSLTTNSTSCSLSPTSVTGSGSSMLSCTFALAQTFHVGVTGSSGPLSYSVTETVVVRDFAIAVSPVSMSVAQVTASTATITLTGLNGFSDTVTMTGTVSPSGPSEPTVSFRPSSVPLSGGSVTSTLTVSAVPGLYNSVANGNFSVNVTATSGSLSHSTIVQVTVSASSSTTIGMLPLSPTVLISLVVVIVAALAVTIYLVKRKTK